VIFSDINMPRRSGFQLLQWVKRQPNFARIPVVMISDFMNPVHREKAFALGAIACLPKPPEPAEAQRLTRKFLRNFQAGRARSDASELPEHSTSGEWYERPRMKKILLADDDPGVRETLGRVLESEHYQVIFAENGNEAAGKSVSGQPDMVLLDLNMPDRDGWSAFRFMHAVHPLLPVIVITARPNQYQQAEQLGVDALMEKPLNLGVLLKAIDALLSETEPERMRRLTSPDFHTAYLNDRAQSSATPWNR
jgi:CheY-like chemotaxis protein